MPNVQIFNTSTTDTVFAVYHKDGYLVSSDSQLLSVNSENAIDVGFDEQRQAEHLARVLDRRGDYSADNLSVVQITVSFTIECKTV